LTPIVLLTINLTAADMSSILIVAIGHDLRVSLRKALEIEGFTVYTSPTGRNALDLLQGISPSAIILDNDISPALMGSGEFISSLKNIDHLKDIPIILMTLKDGKCDVSQVQGSVYKPVDIPKLLELLKQFKKK
jgi:CheY-like chemotaxis protein